VTAELWVAQLGTVGYADGVGLQERLRERRWAGEIPDTALLLEHWPVFTLGRRSGPDDLPMGEDWYRMQGIEIERTDRGGKLTYHGPGQLVGYPIVEVADVVDYVRRLERAVIAALADSGVEAGARTDEGADFTGVWVGDRKIASIGVHFSKGVTTHGFAVNVECDLQPFEWVVPCGLPGVRMTSLIRETGRRDVRTMACFRKSMAHRLAEALGARQRIVTPYRLGLAPAPLAPARVAV
jgi:lipoyl(octanoyl) transferase